MESETFKKWLAERGCTFEQHQRTGRKTVGNAAVTVRLGNRHASLPLVGSRKRLDPRIVKQVVDNLGLEWSELPGPKGRV
jgi:hypothetical protein